MRTTLARILFLGILLLSPTLGGCGSLESGYQAGKKAYTAGEWAQAKTLLETYLADDPFGSDTFSAHWMLGTYYTRQGGMEDKVRAMNHFKAASAPEAPLAVRIRALDDGADLLFAWQEFDPAVSWYDQLIGLEQRAESLPAAYDRLAESQRRAGKWRASVQTYARLLELDPQGPYAQKAQRAMDWKERGHLGFAVEFARHTDVDEALKMNGVLQDERLPTTVAPERKDGTLVYVIRLKKLYRTWAEAKAQESASLKMGYRVEIYPQ